MRSKIKNQIIEKLIETDGQAFIVIDEVQSILPGVIGVSRLKNNSFGKHSLIGLTPLFIRF
jgi:hypothetical protein